MLQEQKRAWVNFGVGVFLCLIILSVLTLTEPNPLNAGAWEEWHPTQSRLSQVCLVLGAVWFTAMFLTRSRTVQGVVARDERDQLIANKALKAQAWTVQILLLIWMIALTETFVERGAIPIGFPFIIWLSCTLGALIAHGAATLFLYRKMS